MPSAKPLDKFPFIRSRDIDEVSEAIARVYGRPAIAPARGTKTIEARINRCRLPHTTLTYSSYGVGVGLDYPETEFFSLLVPIHGTGEMFCGQVAVALPTGAGAVVSAGMAHKANHGADYEHLILLIDARVLAEKLAAMTGAEINNPLRMTPQAGSAHPAAQMLKQYLPLLADTVSAADPPFPVWWVEQTEQLLMTLLLAGYQHNYSHLLEQDAADLSRLHVRQAEDYIEANAERAITLEELATLTGVSAFSLFRSFKKHRGYSPLEFLSQMRSRRGGTSR